MQRRSAEDLKSVEERVVSAKRIIDVAFLGAASAGGVIGAGVWALGGSLDDVAHVLPTFTKVFGAYACARGTLTGWRAYQWDRLGFWNGDLDRAMLASALGDLRSCALSAIAGYELWVLAGKLLA